MNKINKVAAALLLAISLLTAGTAQAGPRIVTTIFPAWDWLREITASTDAELVMLNKNGVDMHSYQPSVDDILTISSCELFVYVGGESDGWVRDALKNAPAGQQALSMLAALGDRAKLEETVAGMQAEKGPAAPDEHVWLSLRNAAVICREIARQLALLDSDHAGQYRANAEGYIAKLDALDAEYRRTVSAAARKTLLFADRFPFRYLTDDYGLTYYAAFAGCSAESEASFATVAFLAAKADELALPCVLTIEGRDHRLAETVVRSAKNKDLKVLTLDSMQAVTAQMAEAGATYLSIMEQDLGVLREALN